jgi:hypothetical protein
MTRRRHRTVDAQVAGSELLGEPPIRPIRAHRRRRQPGLLPPETLDRFLTALRSGLFRTGAATLAGLSPITVEEWIKRGRGQRPRPATAPYVEFVRSVERAEAQAYAQVSGNLFALTRTNPRAALSWLRIRYPQDWPRRPDATPSEPGVITAKPITNHDGDVVYLPIDQFDESIHLLLAAKREQRHLAISSPDPVPARNPERVYRDDRIRRAGLVIDADDRETSG